MKTIDELAEQIIAALTLGDNLHGEVEKIVKGKLLDRHDKLVGKKTRRGETITQDRICNTVGYAVSQLMESPNNAALMAETALYYNLKYEVELNG